MNTRKITLSGFIAALYVVFVVISGPLSFGPLQFRISEILTLTPILFGVEGIVGVTLGCLLSNVFMSSFGLYDIIIGTLATLIAAFLTYLLRKKPLLAAIPPVIINAVFVPLIILLAGALEDAYYIVFFQILISQAIIVYGFGLPFMFIIKKRKIDLAYQQILEQDKNRKKQTLFDKILKTDNSEQNAIVVDGKSTSESKDKLNKENDLKCATDSPDTTTSVNNEKTVNIVTHESNKSQIDNDSKPINTENCEINECCSDNAENIDQDL